MKITSCIVERRIVTGKYEHINITLEGVPDNNETAAECISLLDKEIMGYNTRGN